MMNHGDNDSTPMFGEGDHDMVDHDAPLPGGDEDFDHPTLYGEGDHDMIGI